MDTETFIQLPDSKKIKAIESCQFNPTAKSNLLFEYTFSPIVFEKLIDCKANLWINGTHLIVKMFHGFKPDTSWQENQRQKIIYLINNTNVSQYRGYENKNILHIVTILVCLEIIPLDFIKYIFENIYTQSQIHWCLSEFDHYGESPCSILKSSASKDSGDKILLNLYVKMIHQFRGHLFSFIYPVLHIKNISGIVLDFLTYRESM